MSIIARRGSSSVRVYAASLAQHFQRASLQEEISVCDDSAEVDVAHSGRVREEQHDYLYVRGMRR